MTTTSDTGRRERKKSQTREALRAAAKDLFARQGFAQTSVQQITDAVDVSERTFFRYFASKEDLLLPDLVALFGGLTAALRRRPLAEPPLLAVRQAILSVGQDPALSIGVMALAPGLDPTSPGVDARVKAFITLENQLAEILADRFVEADGHLPRSQGYFYAEVVAKAAVSATRAVLTTVRTRAVDDLTARVDLPALLQQAFSILEAGCPAPLSSRG